jgi:pimeloyl-ACP methyl ester carboxylesterase
MRDADAWARRANASAPISTNVPCAVRNCSRASTRRRRRRNPFAIEQLGASKVEGDATAAQALGVIERLRSAGYTVDAPPSPLQSLKGDAAWIADLLTTIKGPIVLVGHSYGGAVITHAARGNRNVKALVYVDAFAPAKGESALGLDSSKPGSALGAGPTRSSTSCRSLAPRRATPSSTSSPQCSRGRSPTGSPQRRALCCRHPVAGRLQRSHGALGNARRAHHHGQTPLERST